MYQRLPIVHVDKANNQITTSIDKNNMLDFSESYVSAGITHRWKVFNILEELDAPTEWYIDVNAKKLYYYMPEGCEDDTLEISVLNKPMINIVNADNIGFENITFANTRSNAISAVDVDGITVKGCNFKNIGANAFETSGTQKAVTDKDYWQWQWKDAAYNCEISDSVFDNIGGHAIVMDGGDTDTLTKGNNVIQNNIIYNASAKIKNYEGILLRGCGNRVLNNNISHMPFIAIRYYGNDHVISYNEIYDVIRETDDTGAIYSGRNSVQRGTEISYNYIHDMESTFDEVFGHRTAIYWDDKLTGSTAHHNIIKNVNINIYTNGVDHKFTENTSIDIKKNFMFSNGGAASNSNNESSVFAGNIAQSELYYQAYPNLKTIIESSDLNSRTFAQYNEVKNNLTVNATESSDAMGTYIKKPVQGLFGIWKSYDNISNNRYLSQTSDFVDPVAQDYRVKSSSSLASLGVLTESFDIERIGVVSDNELNAPTVETIEAYKMSNGKVRFMWYESYGASEYTLEVATDSDFENIVASNDVRETYTDVSGLDGDNNTYYWRVIAYNNSREFASSWISNTAVFGKALAVKPIVISSEIEGNTAKVYITNNTLPESAVVYIAEYNNDGKLLSVSKEDKTLTLKTEIMVEKTVGNGTIVKAFVWNNVQGPLAESETIR